MPVTEIVPLWVSELKKSYEGDAWAQGVLKDQDLDGLTDSKVSVHNGVIRYKNRIYVGEGHGWRDKVLQSMHDSSVGGH